MTANLSIIAAKFRTFPASPEVASITFHLNLFLPTFNALIEQCHVLVDDTRALNFALFGIAVDSHGLWLELRPKHKTPRYLLTVLDDWPAAWRALELSGRTEGQDALVQYQNVCKRIAVGGLKARGKRGRGKAGRHGVLEQYLLMNFEAAILAENLSGSSLGASAAKALGMTPELLPVRFRQALLEVDGGSEDTRKVEMRELTKAAANVARDGRKSANRLGKP